MLEDGDYYDDILGDDIVDVTRNATAARPAPAKAPGAAPPHPEPAGVGIDLGALQRRSADALAAALAATAPAEAKDDAAPLDLHKEDILTAAGLEDRGLRDHVAQARALAKQSEKDSQEIPSEKSLDAKFAEARRQFSASAISITRILREMQVAIENTYLQSSNATKIAAGEQPHSFPEAPKPPPQVSASLQHLSTRLTDNGNVYQDLHKTLTEVSKQFATFRRLTDEAIDGYARRAKFAEARTAQNGSQ